VAKAVKAAAKANKLYSALGMNASSSPDHLSFISPEMKKL
jgi:hypothetical protein